MNKILNKESLLVSGKGFTAVLMVGVAAKMFWMEINPEWFSLVTGLGGICYLGAIAESLVRKS